MAQPSIKNPLLDHLGELLHATLDPAGLPHQVARAVLLFLYRHLVIYADYVLFALVTVPLYFLVPRRLRPAYLLAVSLVMIAIIWGAVYTLCLLGVVGLTHALVQRWRERALSDASFRRRAIKGLVGGILVAYALLLIRESLEWAPVLPLLEQPLVIPLVHFAGIAFMLPKLIHYIVDSFTGKLPRVRWLPFTLFMMFFPIFRLGPIERFQAFSRTLEHVTSGRVSGFDVGYGLFRVCLGIFKIAVFWSILLPWREDNIALWNVSLWRTYLTMMLGVIEVYFHFGGYTDLAVGLSRMFGLRVMENFYFPMFSENIGEWWRRWHISLSFWLRDYVYRPLGGMKHKAFRNGLITFFICGAWHDVAGHYVIWGVLQAFGLGGLRAWSLFWYRVGRDPAYMRPLKPLHTFMRAHPRLSFTLAVITTYHYFAVTGLYFILDTHKATQIILRLFSFGILGYG